MDIVTMPLRDDHGNGLSSLDVLALGGARMYKAVNKEQHKLSLSNCRVVFLLVLMNILIKTK